MSSSASILENNFNDTVNDAEELPKIKRSVSKAYDFLEDCESLMEFKKLVKNLHFDNVAWNFHSKNNLADCDKNTFNCKFNKKGCKKSIYFKVKNGEIGGSVYISDNEHSNHSNEENSANVPPKVKEKIIYFRSLGQAKKEIKRNLIKENIQPPTDNQIQHIINSVSKDLNKNCSLTDFKKWCEDNSEIPDDEDAVFVGKFEYAAMPSQIFRVFLTSKRLIKIAENAQHFLSDATYKLTYENFPIITGGTTDRNKSFVINVALK